MDFYFHWYASNCYFSYPLKFLNLPIPAYPSKKEDFWITNKTFGLKCPLLTYKFNFLEVEIQLRSRIFIRPTKIYNPIDLKLEFNFMCKSHLLLNTFKNLYKKKKYWSTSPFCLRLTVLRQFFCELSKHFSYRKFTIKRNFLENISNKD